jgi:hypothetical protein
MLKKGSTILSMNLYKLTIGGGVAFWAANFTISRTPISAEYRAALSISYLPMLLESLVAGLMIGFFVSFFLLRSFDKIPTKDPILKSVILTFIVLIIVTILIGGPSSFLATSDVLRYFLIGTIFNVLRFLALGLAIGYLYRRPYKGLNPSAIASKSPQVDSYALFHMWRLRESSRGAWSRERRCDASIRHGEYR